MILLFITIQILSLNVYSSYGCLSFKVPNTKYEFDESKIELPWYKDTWLLPKQVKTRTLLDYSCECGIENPPDVIGQEPYPWMVWITFWKESEGELEYEIKCVGSLINSIMILTNAPCVNKFKFALNKAFYQWSHQRINVYLSIDPPNPLPTNSIPIDNVFFHPEFLKGKLDLDVALIKLKKPVPFKDPKNHIRPICLPGLQDKEKVNKTMIFGSQLGTVVLKMEPLAATAKKIFQDGSSAILFPLKECRKMFREKIHYENFLCAEPQPRPSFPDPTMATTHFGAPLYQALYSDYDIQVGVWSARHFGLRKNEQSELNLFVDIFDIIPFIEDVSNKEGAKWCRHTRIKFNEGLPDHRVKKEITPWVGTTSEGREISPACGCGYRHYVQQGRIVGGHAAIPYNFPWLASLKVQSGMVAAGCGAAIINDLFILTAAHCVFDEELAKTDPDSPYAGPSIYSIEIKILKHKYDDNEDENAAPLEIEEILLHPEFTKARMAVVSSMDYDVALIKLKTRLDFWNEDGPMPICLPSTKEVIDMIGKQGIVAGWGMINPDDPDEAPEELQQIEIPIRPLKDCQDMATQPITNRMLCAGSFDPKKDTLHGDSGGPLMFEFPTKQIMEVGLVSWGDYDFRLSQQLDIETAAALYTDVHSVLDYIDYNSQLHGATWCNRDLQAENARKPWVGAKILPRITSSKCACGSLVETVDNGNLDVDKHPNEMPWLVLVIAVRSNGTQYCTGSIINDLFIITSAECVKRTEITKHLKQSLPPNEVHVHPMPFRANVVDFQSTLTIDSIYLHPGYVNEGTDYDHDIALIKLKTPINFLHEDKLSSVCIPTAHQPVSIDTIKESANTAGWLKEEQLFRSERLVDLPKVKKIEACGEQEYIGTPRKFICVRTKKYDQGMQGGPLMFKEENKPYFQIGIIPGNEKKVTCIKTGKDDEEKPKEEDTYDYSQDDQEGRAMKAFVVPTKRPINSTNSTINKANNTIKDDEGESVKEFWSDADISRKKRSGSQECSMYTAISEVLEFIEFFSSSYGAIWCNGDANKLMKPSEPEDYGLIM